jgi:hypothetical protein
MSNTRSSSFFGVFRPPKGLGEQCVRCGLHAPSVQTGRLICDKSGWCEACTRVPPHVSNNILRECLNLRRAPAGPEREIIESFEESARGEFVPAEQKAPTGASKKKGGDKESENQETKGKRSLRGK